MHINWRTSVSDNGREGQDIVVERSNIFLNLKIYHGAKNRRGWF